MSDLWRELCGGIEPVSEAWRETALRRLDTLTKPLGSLGRLEAVAAQWVAVRRERWDEPMRKGVTIFAADHGVTAEGVSAYPSAVTEQMVLNFLRGGAAVNVLARLHGVDLSIVDVGVAANFDEAPGLVRCKVARGTANLRREAAMTAEQLDAALAVGAEMADRAAERGQTLVAVGEMGIGNTTAASAITSVLTGLAASAVVGRGTGASAEMVARKVEVVTSAVRHHFGVAARVLAEDILRCVGGLEIAAMAGMMLRAARLGVAVVVDGFISTAAAALAAESAPGLRGYLFAGHCSEEPGHGLLLERLGLRPLLTLGMRLGEGSGAVLAMPVLESGVALLREMATFASAGVSEADVEPAAANEAEG